MTVNKSPRSQRLPKIYTPGMKKIIEEASKAPGLPISLQQFRIKHGFKRNDLINIRRQIEKIISMRGPIRYILPDRTHIVYIDDSVKENEISAILAAASAISHLVSDGMIAKKLPNDLSLLIQREISSASSL